MIQTILIPRTSKRSTTDPLDGGLFLSYDMREISKSMRPSKHPKRIVHHYPTPDETIYRTPYPGGSHINSIKPDGDLELVMGCGNIISYSRIDWVRRAAHDHFDEISKFISDGYKLDTKVMIYSVTRGYHGIEIGERVLQAFATLNELLDCIPGRG